MKKSLLGLTLTSCVLVVVACSSGGNKSWNNKMKNASRILSELMPKLSSGKWQADEQEKQQLRALTVQLSGVSHGINSAMAVPSLDPSIKFVSREFKKELTQAELSMDQNNWKEAQARISKATQYCIACHTMTTSGSSAYSLNLQPRLKGLTEYEKAVYFTAVRQFEKALIHYEAALNNQVWADENPEQWGEGILSILSIAGRIKRDPDLILEMVSRFFDTGAYPTALKAPAKQWRVDAKNWRKSKTARINMKMTESYVRQARKLDKAVPNSGLVLHLRASSNLNELLRMGAVSQENVQKSYYLAGQLAEILGKYNFAGFAADYYQICINQSKKTRVTSQCQRALKKLSQRSL